MSQTEFDFTQLALDIKQWGRELGFQQVGITDTNLLQAEKRLQEWLTKNYYVSRNCQCITAMN